MDLFFKCMCVGVCACAHVCGGLLWTYGIFFNLLIFKAGSLIEPQALELGLVSWPASHRDLPAPPPQSWHYKFVPSPPCFFTWAMGSLCLCSTQHTNYLSDLLKLMSCLYFHNMFFTGSHRTPWTLFPLSRIPFPGRKGLGWKSTEY